MQHLKDSVSGSEIENMHKTGLENLDNIDVIPSPSSDEIKASRLLLNKKIELLSNKEEVNISNLTRSMIEDLRDSGSSSDEKSNGSEFGECKDAQDLKYKLPQVQKEIAEMLKLSVIDLLKIF